MVDEIALEDPAPAKRMDLGLPIIDGWAGGDEFDTKPIRFQRLLEKIESLLTKEVGTR